MRGNATNETEFVRNLLDRAFWGVVYHEGELRTRHKETAIVKSVAAQAGIDVSKITAEDYHEEARETAAEFVEQAMAEVLSSIKWQEEELCKAHAAIALAKAVILRGKYDIDIEQVRAAAQKRYDES